MGVQPLALVRMEFVELDGDRLTVERFDGDGGGTAFDELALKRAQSVGTFPWTWLGAGERGAGAKKTEADA